MTKPFYDSLETRAPAEREAHLMAGLPAQVAYAQQATNAYGAILAGVDA
jgi:phenylacetate-CoA ligase